LDGIEAAAVNHLNPTAGAPPLSPPTHLRPSPTRIKVAVSFVVPYSTSQPLPFSIWVLPPPGTRLAAVRRRLPPPARRPAPWAEFLRHFRAHAGRPTLLDLFPSSLAAVLNLADGNTVASRPRACALFWGECRPRERS